MSGNSHNAPRNPGSRVSIDGSRIKSIRESKGLTQLYVATFLGVTPDTVSRWENRKYPTVKWENAEKLAEALQVEVSDLLDFSAEGKPGDQKKTVAREKTPARAKRLLLPAVLALGVLLCLGGVIYVYNGHKESADITAARYLPKHTPAGQAFPVVIRVDAGGEQPFSFIVLEELPEHFAALKGLPEIADRDRNKNRVKWISNASQSPFFLAYLVQPAPGLEPSGGITFMGKIKAGGAPGTEQTITGDSELEISNHHWADTNSDGIIDDEEILVVYSSADVLNRLGVDLESIREIWSGGGYTWNPATKEYVVSSGEEEVQ